MKRYLCYTFIILLMGSCWAPRCPRRSCHVALEHRHEDPVGIYRGRWMIVPPRIHLLWDKNKNDQNAMKQAGVKTPKQKNAPAENKRRPKKLFEWERE